MWNEAGAVRRRSCVVLGKEYVLFSSPSVSEKERRVFFLCSKVEFLSNRARPEPFAEKRACDTAGFPSLATPLYIRCSLCQLRPRREKRIHRQHDEQCCRWILFFVEAQSAHPVCGRKNGGSAPVAERAVRRTGGKGQKVGWRGMKKSGDALRSARRIEKAHGRIEKAHGI